jgi:hypothetical protein
VVPAASVGKAGVFVNSRFDSGNVEVTREPVLATLTCAESAFGSRSSTYQTPRTCSWRSAPTRTARLTRRHTFSKPAEVASPSACSRPHAYSCRACTPQMVQLQGVRRPWAGPEDAADERGGCILSSCLERIPGCRLIRQGPLVPSAHIIRRRRRRTDYRAHVGARRSALCFLRALHLGAA